LDRISVVCFRFDLFTVYRNVKPQTQLPRSDQIANLRQQKILAKPKCFGNKQNLYKKMLPKREEQKSRWWSEVQGRVEGQLWTSKDHKTHSHFPLWKAGLKGVLSRSKPNYLVLGHHQKQLKLLHDKTVKSEPDVIGCTRPVSVSHVVLWSL